VEDDEEPMLSRPFLGVACCTYHRPQQLSHLIWCFEHQDYAQDRRFMAILDDGGVHEPSSGNRWQLYQCNYGHGGLNQRFKTLGLKRNFCVALLPKECDVVVIWDDDDWYAPWALTAIAKAIESGAEFVRPSKVWLKYSGSTPVIVSANGLFHGSWAVRQDVFWKIGGYDNRKSVDEDQDLASRLVRSGVRELDPITKCNMSPYYCYIRWSDNVSEVPNLRGYDLKAGKKPPSSRIVVDPQSPGVEYDQWVMMAQKQG